jgi:hypothetical protein
MYVIGFFFNRAIVLCEVPVWIILQNQSQLQANFWIFVRKLINLLNVSYFSEENISLLVHWSV